MKTLRIIVAGGRDFSNYTTLSNVLNEYLSVASKTGKYDIKSVEFISGRARGADSLGERYANQNCYLLNMFPANWNFMGKPAGYYRNEIMAKFATMDRDNYDAVLIAFWNGESAGTKHMIDLAKQYDFDDIKIINYKSNSIKLGNSPEETELNNIKSLIN